MDAMKQVYLFIICQGFYLGSVCQDWTFPSTITALIGSCVEIPCTYNNPSRISGTSSTVWYLYASRGYTQILNTKDSSSVIGKYKDRTSLVPGEKSCTLRIDPVRREDEDTYYPGIAEKRDRNAYSKYSEIVHLDVTDKVKIMLYWTKFMTEGVATVIQCTVEHTCRSRPPSLQWNKPGQFKKKSVEIVGEYWREESELTYIPSYVDDGTPVQCTATYPNGPRTERSEILNINYAPKNVSIAVIGMNDVIEGSDVTLQCSSYSKPGTYKYEWYKGKNNTKLLDAGRKITVQNVNRDTDPYSCVVVNRLGRGKSATKKIPELYKEYSNSFRRSYRDSILLATIGIICLLFLLLLLYAYWRKKQKKLTRTETVVSYTDLTRSDITAPYDQLQPVIPADASVVGSDVGAAHDYENLKNKKNVK